MMRSGRLSHPPGGVAAGYAQDRTRMEKGMDTVHTPLNEKLML